MGDNNIIDSKDPGIVVNETKITISDEKLSSLLLKAYEAAQQDSRIFRIHDLWGIFWSIAGTLVVALITTDKFASIGPFESEGTRILIIIVCVITTIIGIVLSICRVREKAKNDIISRDKAVEKIVETYKHK